MRGFEGNWPPDDSPDTFSAFCWLLEITAEPIVVANLRGFRRWHYWEDTKLWPYFLKVASPLTVPISNTPIPVVGFLPSTEMLAVLSSDILESELPSRDVRAIRNEVLEIIESLYEDNLDLFAVVMR